MKSKYIIIKRAGMEVPIVFSEFLMHDDVAGKNHVRSAGFCELDAAGKWIASGQSVSLNLSARPQDAEILNIHLCVGNFVLSTNRTRKDVTKTANLRPVA